MNKESTALSRATFAYDQVFACVDEISLRTPAAVGFAVRETGPLSSEGKLPFMGPGEWEILRKLAQLGWAHFSVMTLQRIEEEKGDSP